MGGENLEFNDTHLEAFTRLGANRQDFVGRQPKAWAISVGADVDVYAGLPDKHLNRDYLKAMCNVDGIDGIFTSEQCFLAIMAWGGMQVNHGRRVWNVRKDLIEIIGSLRDGSLSRSDAYEQFQRFRARNPGCGMGPAFYTKLIFFAHPCHDGYIMDQWTARSINLLRDTEHDAFSMHMTKAGKAYRVSDRNCARTYEEFCLTIEELAKRLGISPEAVEERLFCHGGRNPGDWRAYVRRHWPIYAN